MSYLYQGYRSLYLGAVVALGLLLAACGTPPGGGSSSLPQTQSLAAAVDTGSDRAEMAATRTPSYEGERLGTQWGESIVSRSNQVKATRLTRSPIDQAAIAYSSGHYGGQRVNEVMLANGRIGLSILDGHNHKMILTREGDDYRLQGQVGERYQLHYQNYSRDNAYEVIASVDGVDVLSGQPASVRHSGYLLRPGQRLTIEGFRKSQDAVAAFRFSKPADSYAANSAKNSINNTGIIGSAVYQVRITQPQIVPTPMPWPLPPSPYPQAFPGDKGYAKPPVYR